MREKRTIGNRQAIRAEVLEFMKQHPSVCMRELCLECGYSSGYLSTMIDTRYGALSEVSLQQARDILAEGRAHPEKYQKISAGHPKSLMEKTYALYKGDKFIASGTAKEIAKELGITVQSLKFYGTPAYRRRTTEKAYRLIAEE